MSTVVDPNDLPLHFQSREAEEKWDRVWSEAGVYRFDEAGRGEAFVIDTPPPTVSGSLLRPECCQRRESGGLRCTAAPGI